MAPTTLPPGRPARARPPACASPRPRGARPTSATAASCGAGTTPASGSSARRPSSATCRCFSTTPSGPAAPRTSARPVRLRQRHRTRAWLGRRDAHGAHLALGAAVDGRGAGDVVHPGRRHARARTLCVWGSPFGGTSEGTVAAVRLLTDGVCANYGHAGPRLARWLLDTGAISGRRQKVPSATSGDEVLRQFQPSI
jgi:hypothetical protein